ncbi:MAG: DNA polymerase III subunit delta' [Methyloglobulus sp.]|nr:DNA polymerase III subunit delta' [Methyloglobulus sp.]
MTVIKHLAPWQHNDWLSLCRYIKQQRIPQALLISGTSGIGKQTLAQQFTNALLCENRQEDGFSCGHCHSCLLINARTHPDLIRIQPDEEKKTISIKQIRNMVTDTYLKPQFKTHRVIIINPADVMTTSAVNAFLKCLEEPTERTVFILITDKPNHLPATIISRCQKLMVNLPEKPILTAWLKEQGIDSNQEILIDLITNSILKMPQLANQQSLLKQRTDFFNDWISIAHHKNHPAIIAEKWHKMSEIDLINWLMSWQSDLIKFSFNVNSKHICNKDFSKTLQELSQQLDLKGLYGLYERLLTRRQQLGTQLNFQIMLEDIFAQWQGLNGRS